jgi:hypothetical protein
VAYRMQAPTTKPTGGTQYIQVACSYTVYTSLRVVYSIYKWHTVYTSGILVYSVYKWHTRIQCIRVEYPHTAYTSGIQAYKRYTVYTSGIQHIQVAFPYTVHTSTAHTSTVHTPTYRQTQWQNGPSAQVQVQVQVHLNPRTVSTGQLG